MKPTVGVVGLGAMGKAIASNLLKAGFQTTVWNRSPEPISQLVSQGALAARNVGEALKCDIVLSVLFNDAAVGDVFLKSHVLESASSATIHVCMSTISYGSAIASGNSPGTPSGLQLPLKDVGLTLGEAKALGTRTPFAAVLQEQLEHADRLGLGREDWSLALASVARTRDQLGSPNRLM